MDKLSPELLALIVAHLSAKPPPGLTLPILFAAPPAALRLAPLATLSRRWQLVIEAKTLAHIRLKCTGLATFAAIFGDLRRRALLRRLDYKVCLPAHGDSRDGHAANQAAFRNAVTDLLALMHSWERDLPENYDGGGFELQLEVQWDIDMSEGPVDFHFDVIRSSASRKYLTFNDVRLPAVHRITAFTVSARPGLAPHPTAMCKLAGAMPQLKELELEYLDPVNKQREARMEHRIALAAGLRELDLHGLTHLRIGRYSTTETYNHSFNCQDFEDNRTDALNDAFRRLSQATSLTDLHLYDILASPDLFKDRHALNGDTSIWPNLRRFTITAGIVSSSGTWFYTGDPDAVEPGSATAGFQFGNDDDDDDDDDNDDNDEEGEDEDAASSDVEVSTESSDDPDRDALANGTRPTHAWRTRPDPDAFDPLILDLADAVLWMPRLQSGHFEVGTAYGDPIGIVFKVADVGCGFEERLDWKTDGEGERRVRRWHVWVGTKTEWEVPREVEAKMRMWLGERGEFAVGRWPPSW